MGHGASVVGVDLSEAMVEAGRRAFPGVEFRRGDLLDVPAADAEFGAVVALYSIIHLERGELPRAFAEIRRVLRPGGTLLVSFHIGSEVRHLSEFLGHALDVDFHFFALPEVVQVMEEAGFAVDARLDRANHPGEVETRRAYVVGRRREEGAPAGTPS